MQKKSIGNINVTCQFQEFRFDRIDIRNKPLYEGRYLKLVHRKDGGYYVFIKSLRPKTPSDKIIFASCVFYELTEALNSIK